MSKKSVEELIGRALTDVAFRSRLFASPEATLAEEGYEVTPEIVEAIRSANPDEINSVAKEFESQIAQRKAAA